MDFADPPIDRILMLGLNWRRCEMAEVRFRDDA